MLSYRRAKEAFMVLHDLSGFDSPLFESVDPIALEGLRAQMHRREIAPGEALFSQDDPSTFFAIIGSGTGVVERHDPPRTLRLGTVCRGDVVGELGLLRDKPRLATITAEEELTVGIGDAKAFESLLHVPGVGERMRTIVSLRLAQHATAVSVPMPNKPTVLMRPLLPTDRSGLQRAAQKASSETLRRRFFTSVIPSERMLDYLVFVDYVDHFAWVCLTEDGQGIGIGRYVRDHDDRRRAEFAFTVADDWQGRGVGTRLLGAVAVAAESAGIRHLDAHFLAENAPAQALFGKANAVFSRDEPGVLDASFKTADAMRLLSDDAVGRLDASVADIVRAAGLALAPGSRPKVRA